MDAGFIAILSIDTCVTLALSDNGCAKLHNVTLCLRCRVNDILHMCQLIIFQTQTNNKMYKRCFLYLVKHLNDFKDADRGGVNSRVFLKRNFEKKLKTQPSTQLGCT